MCMDIKIDKTGVVCGHQLYQQFKEKKYGGLLQG